MFFCLFVLIWKILVLLAYICSVVLARLFEIFQELSHNTYVSQYEIIMNALSVLYRLLTLLVLMHVTSATTNEVDKFVFDIEIYATNSEILSFKKSRSTSVIVHKLMNLIKYHDAYWKVSEYRMHESVERTDDRNLSFQLLSFSKQLQCHKPIVNCGLFTIDWRLFFTVWTGDFSYFWMFNEVKLSFQMIGSGTTYIIILIQFDPVSRQKELDCVQSLNNTQY